MNPTFVPDYVTEDLYETLLREVPWVNVGAAPRDECFMARDPSLTYTYGKANRTRLYRASPMHAAVEKIRERLNREFALSYNVCVLNYYRDEHQHLGWHADDSPEQDPAHPIAVLAFGATRELWTRPRGATGAVRPEDRYRMTPGGLFVMPPGYQDTHVHRIPKHDRPCGGRISLTYRKLDR